MTHQGDVKRLDHALLAVHGLKSVPEAGTNRRRIEAVPIRDALGAKKKKGPRWVENKSDMLAVGTEREGKQTTKKKQAGLPSRWGMRRTVIEEKRR